MRCIISIAFNRPEHFKASLNSIRSALDIGSPTVLLVVLQGENAELIEIIERIDWVKTICLRIRYVNCFSPRFMINYNVRKGIQYAFDKVGADNVVVIEDDVFLSKDAFNFISHIY